MAEQGERRARDSSGPTGFQVALGHFQQLDKTERRAIFWVALGLVGVPGLVVMAIVGGAVFTDRNVAAALPSWFGMALGGMFFVGVLMLFPERALKGLHAVTTLVAKLIPPMGKLFQAKERRKEDQGPPTP